MRNYSFSKQILNPIRSGTVLVVWGIQNAGSSPCYSSKKVLEKEALIIKIEHGNSHNLSRSLLF